MCRAMYCGGSTAVCPFYCNTLDGTPVLSGRFWGNSRYTHAQTGRNKCAVTQRPAAVSAIAQQYDGFTLLLRAASDKPLIICKRTDRV